MSRLALFAALSLLSACAHVDIGQIDYRVAEKAKAPGELERQIASCLEQGLECRPLSDARLVRKYVPVQSPFQTNEVYSIELEQAVIGPNLLEGHILGRQFGKRGEFAILANSFEFGTDQSARRFLEVPEYEQTKNGEGGIELKLVYFGDDIAKHQPFNFSNIPLMPRAVYNGGSVGIQIVIMEVDARSQPITSLLETLAKFGQKTLPGPPEATNILFDLGESLLQGSQDDRLFDYRFVMSSGAALDAEGKLGPIATFAPGRYIFRRAQRRDTQMEWKDLTFDYNTGRLMRGKDEVRNELYFVLNVRRYPQGTAAENYEHAGWNEFRQALQSAADARGAPLTSLTQNLNELLGQQRSTQWRSLLAERWNTAERQLIALSNRSITGVESIEPAGDQMCVASKSKAKLLRDVAARNARDAVRQFVADYQAALQAKTSDDAQAPSELTVKDRESIVSAVARYFMPWTDEQLKATFDESAMFEQSYLAGESRLQDLAEATAIARGLSISDCESLRRTVEGWS